MPGESQPSYLRVVHNYPISVHWMLSEPDSFHDKSKRVAPAAGVYIGWSC
jgi:hypothetical protein